MNKDSELLQQLVKILSNHCGETGENEGAVETLNRIIEDADKYVSMRKDDACGTLYEGYEKYVQSEKQLEELLGNTTENPEHCCEAFEHIRDMLQKIVRENNAL